MQPLSGIRVLDFSTLLPGPMATLMLAEAGAEVIKIERIGSGEELRHYQPRFGDTSVSFAMLNRGKRSITIDLKSPSALKQLTPLIESADVVVDQFRPGVMERLGLGYQAMREINPRIIYCAITGYGQSGPKAQIAAHDLNYQAESGMLAIAADSSGAPVVPAALVADIAGGAYPAVINILLALRARDQSGHGCMIDVSMSDNLFTFLYWAIGTGTQTGLWPQPGDELLSGGSPRYQVYRTAEGKFIAVAALEEKFWNNLCEVIGLPPQFREDRTDPQASKRAVAEIIALRTSQEWAKMFDGKDVCACVVKSVEEAMHDPHFAARGLFGRTVASDEDALPAVSVPIDPAFRDQHTELRYPSLGEANELLGERPETRG
jgi:alpha-methylacyl-CoA racemase